MKRITALLMVAALVVSVFPLAAFAKSEAHEGMYGGYYYKASLTSTTSTATTRMTYAGSSKIHSSGNVIYKNSSSGSSYSASLFAPAQKSSTSATKSVGTGYAITSVSQSYCVLTTSVTSIGFNVS